MKRFVAKMGTADVTVKGSAGGSGACLNLAKSVIAMGIVPYKDTDGIDTTVQIMTTDAISTLKSLAKLVDYKCFAITLGLDPNGVNLSNVDSLYNAMFRNWADEITTVGSLDALKLKTIMQRYTLCAEKALPAFAETVENFLADADHYLTGDDIPMKKSLLTGKESRLWDEVNGPETYVEAMIGKLANMDVKASIRNSFIARGKGTVLKAEVPDADDDDFNSDGTGTEQTPAC